MKKKIRSVEKIIVKLTLDLSAAAPTMSKKEKGYLNYYAFRK